MVPIAHLQTPSREHDEHTEGLTAAHVAANQEVLNTLLREESLQGLGPRRSSAFEVGTSRHGSMSQFSQGTQGKDKDAPELGSTLKSADVVIIRGRELPEGIQGSRSHTTPTPQRRYPGTSPSRRSASQPRGTTKGPPTRSDLAKRRAPPSPLLLSAPSSPPPAPTRIKLPAGTVKGPPPQRSADGMGRVRAVGASAPTAAPAPAGRGAVDGMGRVRAVGVGASAAAPAPAGRGAVAKGVKTAVVPGGRGRGKVKETSPVLPATQPQSLAHHQGRVQRLDLGPLHASSAAGEGKKRTIPPPTPMRPQQSTPTTTNTSRPAQNMTKAAPLLQKLGKGGKADSRAGSHSQAHSGTNEGPEERSESPKSALRSSTSKRGKIKSFFSSFKSKKVSSPLNSTQRSALYAQSSALKVSFCDKDPHEIKYTDEASSSRNASHTRVKTVTHDPEPDERLQRRESVRSLILEMREGNKRVTGLPNAQQGRTPVIPPPPGGQVSNTEQTARTNDWLSHVVQSPVGYLESPMLTRSVAPSEVETAFSEKDAAIMQSLLRPKHSIRKNRKWGDHLTPTTPNAALPPKSPQEERALSHEASPPIRAFQTPERDVRNDSPVVRRQSSLAAHSSFGHKGGPAVRSPDDKALRQVTSHGGSNASGALHPRRGSRYSETSQTYPYIRAETVLSEGDLSELNDTRKSHLRTSAASEAGVQKRTESASGVKFQDMTARFIRRTYSQSLVKRQSSRSLMRTEDEGDAVAVVALCAAINWCASFHHHLFGDQFKSVGGSEPEMLSNSDMIPEVIKTALAASANVANTANAPKVEVVDTVPAPPETAVESTPVSVPDVAIPVVPQPSHVYDYDNASTAPAQTPRLCVQEEYLSRPCEPQMSMLSDMYMMSQSGMDSPKSHHMSGTLPLDATSPLKEHDNIDDIPHARRADDTSDDSTSTEELERRKDEKRRKEKKEAKRAKKEKEEKKAKKEKKDKKEKKKAHKETPSKRRRSSKTRDAQVSFGENSSGGSTASSTGTPADTPVRDPKPRMVNARVGTTDTHSSPHKGRSRLQDLVQAETPRDYNGTDASNSTTGTQTEGYTYSPPPPPQVLSPAYSPPPPQVFSPALSFQSHHTSHTAGTFRNGPVNSATLWADFLERGEHPLDITDKEFVPYCQQLGYTVVEALCICALWFDVKSGAAQPSVARHTAKERDRERERAAAQAQAQERERAQGLTPPHMQASLLSQSQSFALTPQPSSPYSTAVSVFSPGDTQYSTHAPGHVITDCPDGLLPIGEGAYYKDLAPSTALFKSISEQVKETCMSGTRNIRFRVVRVVEAICSEHVKDRYTRHKGPRAAKVLYHNPLRMQPFLKSVVEGIPAETLFSTGAVIAKRPEKGQGFCLLLSEVAVGTCKAVKPTQEDGRKDLLSKPFTPGVDSYTCKFSARRGGRPWEGRHYYSRHPALPRYMVQVEAEEAVFTGSLTVTCASIPFLNGTYRSAGIYRDYPLYKNNTCRLFTDTRGGWMFCENPAGIKKDEGVVASTAAHKGALPDCVVGWKCSNGEAWVKAQLDIEAEYFVEEGRTVSPEVLSAVQSSEVVDTTRTVFSYGQPIAGYGLWQWTFRISSCDGTVGFGIGGAKWVDTTLHAASDVTIQLALSQASAVMSIHRVNDEPTPHHSNIPIWAPTQLIFPQVGLPDGSTASVKMLNSPRLIKVC